MRGADRPQSQGGEQRESDYGARGHDGERREIGPARPRLAERQERGGAGQTRERGPRRAEEQRIHAGQREARGDQRGAEDRDADETVHPGPGRGPTRRFEYSPRHGCLLLTHDGRGMPRRGAVGQERSSRGQAFCPSRFPVQLRAGWAVGSRPGHAASCRRRRAVPCSAH